MFTLHKLAHKLSRKLSSFFRQRYSSALSITLIALLAVMLVGGSVLRAAQGKGLFDVGQFWVSARATASSAFGVSFGAATTPVQASYDFGDLPDTIAGTSVGNYETTLANNGPRHVIGAILRIGSQIDSEANGASSSGADGDDLAGAPDDEDGVQFKTPLRPGDKAVIAVGIRQPLSSTVYLSAWIDFNQDGDFSDAGEQIASDAPSVNGTVRTDASGQIIDVNVPSDALPGNTGARFRLSSTPGSSNTPYGEASDGEVEDYFVTIPAIAKLGNFVWRDTNGDGIQQSGEAGIPGIQVNVRKASDNSLVESTYTDAAGQYLFPHLLPGTYYVEVIRPAGFSAFSPVLQGSDPTVDSDVVPATGRTANVILNGGDDNQTLDAGLIPSTNSLSYCEGIPRGPTELSHTFQLPKFNPALGTLTGVTVSYSIGLRQFIGGENRAAQAQSARITTSSDAFLTLPDSSSPSVTVGFNTGLQPYQVYDGITDYSGTSSFSYPDWQVAAAAGSQNYTALADFTGTTPNETVAIPFETLSGFSVAGGGGNIAAVQRTFANANVCVTYTYVTAPTLSVGNRVWQDSGIGGGTVNDGMQNGTEPGIGGASVSLYADVDGNGTPDNLSAPVATVITDSNGYYRFDGVTRGKYVVRVNPSNFMTGGVLIGSVSSATTVNSGTNTTDRKDNGIDSSSATTNGILSASFDLQTKAIPTNETDNQTPGTYGTGATTGTEASNALTDLTVDFGFALPQLTFSIGNTIWFDTNNNGIIEMTELGKDGVLVDLFFDADGNGAPAGDEQTPIARQLTTSGGHYLFTQTTSAAGVGTGTGLAAGSYVVGISPYNFVAAGAPATMGGAPFMAGMLSGYLSSNTSASNAGVVTDPQLASNGLTNSDQDNFDDGLKQASGFYAAGVLSQALTLAKPEPLGETTKPSGTTGGATPGHNNTIDGTAGGTAISDDNSNVTVDFGFYSQCLGNVVFEDNGAGGGTTLNGLKDGSEPGLNGVTLKLYSMDGLTEIAVGADGILGTTDDAAGGVVTATVGGVTGTYKFGGLPAGSYKVQVAIPAGLNSTADSTNTGNPDLNTDNDDNLVGGGGGVQFSPAISLVAGAEPTINNAIALTTNNTLDFGVARAYSLGNRVWKDLDNNGLLNGAEVGVQGVVLKLLKADLSPATDLSGAAVANQTTDANGYYRFDNLPAGDYVVEVLASNFTGTGVLKGCLSSGIDAGDPDTVVTDSDDNGTGISPDATNGIRSAAVTLGDGNGAAEPTTDNDPTTNPAAGEAVNNQSNRTVDFGFIPTYSLGNRVWKDLNNSGTLDGAEVGVDGVVLRLLKGGVQATDANGVLVADQTTASGGYYRFDNLATGDYVVEVRASNFIGAGALVGCVSSSVNAGDPDTDVDDSDDNGLGVNPDATNGIRSDAITLGPAVNSEPTTETDRSPTDPTEPNGMTNLTLDFGFMPTYALGNRVWKDLDNNGALNGAEAGVNGVTLLLLKASTLAQATDAAGVLVADQTTTSGGYYRFDNLIAGDYVVEVRAANFTGAGVLLSCVSSNTDAGDPDTDVDDSDDNGLGVAPNATTGIRSAAITLGPAVGSEPMTEADRSPTDPAEPNGSTNLTLDFGFTGLYSLGNRVWKDMDDSGTLNNSEAGLNGIVVKLLKGDLTPANDIFGNAVANQTTAGGGYYRFDILATGDYVVEITAANFTGTGILVGCNSSTTDAGDPDTDVDDNDDSGIGLSPDATNGIRSAAITLGDGNGAAEPTTDNDPATNPQAGEAVNAQSNRTVDFGFRPVMTIGNLVWKDQNNNGKYEVPELDFVQDQCE